MWWKVGQIGGIQFWRTTKKVNFGVDLFWHRARFNNFDEINMENNENTQLFKIHNNTINNNNH